MFYRNVLKKASDRSENLRLGGARAESSKTGEKTAIPRHSWVVHSRKARKATIVASTMAVIFKRAVRDEYKTDSSE
jgi:hypothetical protein